MASKSQKGFTLIELLVVIAIIGLLSTLAVVALNSARQKSRDSKRVADIKQMQTALELYFADKNGYPVQGSPVAITLGSTTDKVLCDGGLATGFQDLSTSCAAANPTIYMGLVPAAPQPVDGTCTSGQNDYSYSSAAATSYNINFCLGGIVGNLQGGVHNATPNGMQ